MEDLTQTVQTQAPIQPVENALPQSSNLPPQPKKDMHISKKLLVVALILLLIVSIAGTLGAIFLNVNKQVDQPRSVATNPTPTPTKVSLKFSPPTESELTSWKEYANEKVNYTIKFPQDYTLNEGKASSIDGEEIKSPNITSLISSVFPESKGKFHMTISHNTTTELKATNFIKNSSFCKSITETNGISYDIDGSEALVYADAQCGPRGIDFVVFIKNGVLYQITIEATATGEEIKPAYGKILSTFKFAN